MYKSCPLFVITTKIELSMPVRSLNINLSNAAIRILSCSSAFVKKDLPSSHGFFPREDKGDWEGPIYHLLLLSLENRRWGRGIGASQSFGNFNLITPSVLYGYTRSWIHIHQVTGSLVMPDRCSTNFVKSTVFFYLARLLLLCRFKYTINFTTLSFSVLLMVSLQKILLLLS